jgi:hypothetical protein
MAFIADDYVLYISFFVLFPFRHIEFPFMSFFVCKAVTHIPNIAVKNTRDCNNCLRICKKVKAIPVRSRGGP